jgi:hypothetical protein
LMASTLWAEEFSKCTQVVSNAKPNQIDGRSSLTRNGLRGDLSASDI